MTLGSLLAATTPLLGFGFCLDFFVKNSFAAVSVCETPTREINHSYAESLQLSYVCLSSYLCSFKFLLVFFVALAGISLLGEVNRVVTRLIARGVVVLRLLDSGLRI